MNILFKGIFGRKVARLAVFSLVLQGPALFGAAQSSDLGRIKVKTENSISGKVYKLSRYPYDDTLFKDMCFKAKELAKSHGYRLQTNSLNGELKTVRANVFVDQKKKEKASWFIGRNDFINPVQDRILYQDDSVSVIRAKKKSRINTELYIVPNRLYLSLDDLHERNLEHVQLLNHIALIASCVATHLQGTNKSYTLSVNNKADQREPHFHVIFKAVHSPLDEVAFKKECAVNVELKSVIEPIVQSNLPADTIEQSDNDNDSVIEVVSSSDSKSENESIDLEADDQVKSIKFDTVLPHQPEIKKSNWPWKYITFACAVLVAVVPMVYGRDMRKQLKHRWVNKSR